MRFQHILADPAWKYNDRKLVRKDTKLPRFGMGAGNHYRCETAEQMATIPVLDLADDVCNLWMWATCPMLPDAFWLMDAWGFQFCTVAFVWVKCNPRPWAHRIHKLAEMLLVKNHLPDFLEWLTFYGPGFHTASNIELVLLGRRGQTAQKPKKCPRQLIFAPRTKHSRKPDGAHERIQAAYPNRRYIELFARRQYPGWVCLGNEIDGMDMRESIPLVVEDNYDHSH